MIVYPNHLSINLLGQINTLVLYGNEPGMIRAAGLLMEAIFQEKYVQTESAHNITEEAFLDNPERYFEKDLFSLNNCRFVHVTEVSDKIMQFKSMLENADNDVFVVLHADKLKKNSKAVQWALSASKAGALACYENSLSALKRVYYAQTASVKNVSIPAPLWPALLKIHLEEWPDVLIKIVLLVGETGVLTEQIWEELGVALAPDITQLGLSLLQKKPFLFHTKNLWGEDSDDESAKVALVEVRKAISQLTTLLFMTGEVIQGRTQNEVLNTWDPPLFFKDKPFFGKALRVWDAPDITKALHVLSEMEKHIKTKDPQVVNDVGILKKMCAL